MKKYVNCLYGDQKEVNVQTQKVQMDPNGKSNLFFPDYQQKDSSYLSAEK